MGFLRFSTLLLLAVFCLGRCTGGPAGARPGLGDGQGFLGITRIVVAKVFLRANDGAPTSAAHFDELAVLDAEAKLYLFPRNELSMIPALGSALSGSGKRPVAFTYTTADQSRIAVSGVEYRSLIVYSPLALFHASLPAVDWKMGLRLSATNFQEMSHPTQYVYEDISADAYGFFNAGNATLNYGSAGAFAKPASLIVKFGASAPAGLRFVAPCANQYSMAVVGEAANVPFVASSIRLYVNGALVENRAITASGVQNLVLGAQDLGLGSTLDIILDAGTPLDATSSATRIDAQIFSASACP